VYVEHSIVVLILCIAVSPPSRSRKSKDYIKTCINLSNIDTGSAPSGVCRFLGEINDSVPNTHLQCACTYTAYPESCSWGKKHKISVCL